MKPARHDDCRSLLRAARAGNRRAHDLLFESMYEELCRIARRNGGTARDGAMQATALANETYILLRRRLPGSGADGPLDRASFLRAVALAMRLVSRDARRKQAAAKRGGIKGTVSLEGKEPPDPNGPHGSHLVEVLALYEAMRRLERHNRGWFEVLVHRYFLGHTLAESGELLGVGITSVKSRRRQALAWLRQTLDGVE